LNSTFSFIYFKLIQNTILIFPPLIYGYNFSAGEKSDGIVDSDKKDDDETNKKDKNVVDKKNGN